MLPLIFMDWMVIFGGVNPLQFSIHALLVITETLVDNMSKMDTIL